MLPRNGWFFSLTGRYEICERTRHRGASHVQHQTLLIDRPALAAPAVSPAVVFDKVSFAFDELVVLRNISFRIPRAA